MLLLGLHELDPTGYLLEQEPGVWTNLRIPLEAEETELWRFPISNTVIERGVGGVLMPRRFTETAVEELRRHRRGYRFIGSLVAANPPPAIPSIAVLPLENLSHNPEQEYFADGLTDALITNLAKIGSLRVISRTTAMHYKGTRRPLSEIVCELKVDTVVEGAVQRSGDRVRISAQLIDAATDTHLWAESYESDVRDVLGLAAPQRAGTGRWRIRSLQRHRHPARHRGTLYAIACLA